MVSATNYRSAANVSIAKAREALHEATDRTRSAEQARMQMLGWLGTDEQRAGTGLFAQQVPGAAEFLGSYDLDSIYKQQLEEAQGDIRGNQDPYTSHGRKEKAKGGWFKENAIGRIINYSSLGAADRVAVGFSRGPGTSTLPQPFGPEHQKPTTGGDEFRGGLSIDEFWAFKTDDVINLSREAQIRMDAGDLVGAKELKNQADYLRSLLPEKVQEALNYHEDPARRGIYNASSMKAQIVGNQIGRAKDLQDRTSNEFKQTYNLLAGDSVEAIHLRQAEAEGNIAAEHNSIIRQTKTLVTQRGGTDQGDDAILERAAEQAGFMRAQLRSETAAQEADILGQTSQFLETMKVDFAGDALGFTSKWMDEASGTRSEYLLAMGNVAMSRAKAYTNIATDTWQEFLNKKGSEGGGFQWTSLLPVVGAVVGSIVPGVGTALGGALGGAAAGVANAANK